MSKYKITCCSTVDMPVEFFTERNVPIAYYHFEMDGKDYADDMGKSMSVKEFYERVHGGAMPVTSQINATAYTALFEPILMEGFDIIHLTMSSGITGSINSAKLARDDLLQRYPERKLYIVDSLAASSGYGLLVDEVLNMRDDNVPIDEVYNWVEENKLNLHHWVFASDLKHLKRGGRVSSASAVVGSLLNICPIINVNESGHLIPRDKIRGRKNATAELLRKMKEFARDGLDYSGKCFISNAGCTEDGKALAELVKSTFPKINGEVLVNDIGTVIGSHTGVGTVAIFFWSDTKRTE